MSKKPATKGKKKAAAATGVVVAAPRARRAKPETAPATTASKANPRARALAIEAARVAEGYKCEEILVLDVQGVSSICDFMVIATGTSDRQMRAVSDHIESAARALGDKPYRTAGIQQASWIVLDFVDVVIHLFDPEARRYYDLEMLWGDAPRVSWEARPAARSAVAAD